MKKDSSADLFVTLMQVAADDPSVRSTLFSLLKLDDFNRQSALNTLLHELRLKQAPAEFIQTMSILVNDDVAHKALQYLEGAG